MFKPDYEQIMTLAKDYSVIPVYRELNADVITPILLLQKLAAISNRYYLLESVEGGEKWGRYSFLGYDPQMRVTCKQNQITVEQEEKTVTLHSDKPFTILRDILKDYKAPKIENLPPFTGGFVGYFAYSMIGYAEPKLKLKSGEFNDFDLMLFDKIIVFDHLKQKLFIIVNMKTDDTKNNYCKALVDIDNIVDIVKGAIPKQECMVKDKVEFVCNVSKDEYSSMIEKTKEYIREGDIFQAVISRQFVTPYKNSLINAYRVLRTTNPSPYMVFMNIDGDEIMSTSPETLVRLQNGRLTTFPVAGSRPRGKTKEEDERLEQELLADEKELSEHNMLVDLGRNDLGRISKFNTVEVTKYMMIHRYSKIMHICSQVESEILPQSDGLSAIETVLPAGTLSGAPKIRACEIIDELEKEPRGIYGGALGYLDFTGNMDTCIAIRMAVKKKDKVYVQAGGGIVADSVAEKEYEESENKALAVMNAIKGAMEVENG
ncbi:MAG: trpE [Lachnospiraceae bacterium]|jgi:anthranilate synthase component 1|nr:trpE [Lachnospiraceae bacterium]